MDCLASLTGSAFMRARVAQFQIEGLIKETSKSWVFEARDLTLKRKVALKILRPGLSFAREVQFLEEGERLANLGKHENLTTVYCAGKEDGLYYLCMEHVPGEDLEQIVSSGRKFSVGEVVDIGISVATALDYMHEKGITHGDIKRANIKHGSKYFVVDLGGRLGNGTERSDDVFSTGLLLKELLHTSGADYPYISEVDKIIEKALRNQYITPLEFKEALERYKRSETRRSFLKKTFGFVAVAGVASLVPFIWTRSNSIDNIVGEISRTSAVDYAKINLLYQELAFRIADEKIKLLIEQGIFKKGSPYATTNSNWHVTGFNKYPSGYAVGLLIDSYEITKDETFLNAAIELAGKMSFTEEDDLTINPFRFLRAHGRIYEANRGEKYIDATIKAAEKMLTRFNPNGEFIQLVGKIDESQSLKRIELSTMRYTIPLLAWAYNQSGDSKYLEVIRKHTDTVVKYCWTPGKSVLRTAIIDPSTGKLVRIENTRAPTPESVLARTPAKLAYGLLITYKSTGDDSYLRTAQEVIDFYLEETQKHSRNGAPHFVLGDQDNIPENFRKTDNSADIFAISSLALLGDEESKRAKYERLKRITVQDLITGSSDGLVKRVCLKLGGAYESCSTSQVDFHYLDELKRLV